MDFKEMRNTLEKMANDNFEDFTKALISFEKEINDKETLDKVYQVYMDNDSMGLLNDEFDYLIDEFRENGQIKESAAIEKEDNNLVNIVGNVVGEIETIERENKNGEAFKVVNFSVVSKDDEGNKILIKSTVKTTGKTGVEMEALTMVSIAGLTIYDMCKSMDKFMVIGEIRLVEKHGGKSGDWVKDEK